MQDSARATRARKPRPGSGAHSASPVTKGGSDPRRRPLCPVDARPRLRGAAAARAFRTDHPLPRPRCGFAPRHRPSLPMFRVPPGPSLRAARARQSRVPCIIRVAARGSRAAAARRRRGCQPQAESLPVRPRSLRDSHALEPGWRQPGCSLSDSEPEPDLESGPPAAGPRPVTVPPRDSMMSFKFVAAELG